MAQASIKIGASMSEYQAAMKAAVASMKQLSSEYSLAAANAKLYGTKSDALKAKISELTQKMDVQKTKVEDCKSHYETLTTRLDNNKKKSEELKAKVAELSKAYEESKEATGENSEETKKLKTELDKAEKQLATTEAQTTKYEAAVKKQGAAVTQAEADLANMEVQLRDVNAELARQKFDEYAEKAGKVGQAVQTAGQHMMKVTTAIGGVAAASVTVAANFEQQMSKVQAISGATAKDTDRLTESARQWGRDTKYSATEAGEAFEYMALAGWKTDDMLEGIGGILNLAAASAMDLGTASDIVTDYLTAFGLSAKDAGKFADEMAYAMSHSNTTTEALGEAYKNCAATAASMGYSVEETTAVLMTMANAGVKGGEAGTALNAIMTRLATDTKGCATELSKYGVEVYDAQGNMNSLSSILTGVRGVWNNLTDEQQANLAKTIAGTNQFSALQTIMSGLSDEAIASGMSFSDYSEALQNCDGTASDMAATMQDAYNVRVAWNNNSKYIQLEYGQLAIYNGDVTAAEKRAVFDERGNHFYRDGYYVGKIGTNEWSGNNAHKGLVFDLDYQGKYMAFAQMKSQSAGSYATMLCFSRANSIYDQYGIHLGCDFYGHWFDMYNVDLHDVNINGYGVADGKSIPIVTEIHDNGNGTVGWTTSSISVRGGMITAVPQGSANI